MGDQAGSDTGNHSDEPLDKQAATVAVLFAVLAGLAGILGQNAANGAFQLQSEASLRKVEMADQWAYYQARSTKLAVFRTHQDLLQQLKPGSLPRAEFQQSVAEYDHEQKDIMEKAASLQKQAEARAGEAEFKMKQNDRFDLSVALLQVATAIVSLTVLGKKRWMLGVGVLVGFIGSIFSILALVMGAPG